MNRTLLLALQKRNQERLAQLQTQVQDPELRAADLEAIQTEITEITTQLQEIATELAEDTSDNEGEGSEGDEGDDTSNESGSENRGTNNEEGGNPEQRGGIVNPEQRAVAMTAISSALSTRNAHSSNKREKEIRSAFAKFVVGHISEAEARSLGIVAGNGSVVVPEVIATEIITYAQEENLLRKYGTVHPTKGNVKYPVLVKKAEANVNKKERTSEIQETDIEFDEILLDPAEFDALATVSKKLIHMSGVNVEDIVIEELKKAYVRKETNYMFNGDDTGNENPGALAKKAVAFYETSGDALYDTLVKLKNTPVTAVVKKSRWIINRAALTAIETMKTTDGLPLLRPMTQAEGGIGYTLLGHPLDFTDDADGTDPTKPVFYFGDFSSFHIQDVIGGMQIQKLIEKFSGTNKIGYQIYNLLDGQLIYSPLEPTAYRYEVGQTNPDAPVGA